MAAKRKAGGFLNRAGADAEKYRSPRYHGPPSMGGWNKAMKAKHQLIGEITTAMSDDREAWRAFQKARNRPRFDRVGLEISSTAKHIPGFDAMSAEQRYDLMYEEVNERIHRWACTSGNEHYEALMMQKAIKDEFQTTGEVFAKSQSAETVALVEQEYEFHADWYRRFARTMYQNTQDAFAAEGITEISVYRGMRYLSNVEWAQPGAPRRIWLQPANSWSTRQNISERFGDSVFEVTVSVDRVLGNARSGFGCLNEYEYVVLDTDGLAHLGKKGGRQLPLEHALAMANG